MHFMSTDHVLLGPCVNDYREIPEQFADQGATLVFRAEWESMAGEHIADGDLLYLREEADSRHARGRVVVCVVSGSP